MIASGREVLIRSKQLLANHQSFAVETTLSGKGYLQMLLDARELGFRTVLIYVGTEDVEINLVRIANRVLAGGHNVPEADVRRRYQRSLSNLPPAIARCDHSILFDNSTQQAFRLVAHIDGLQAEWFEPMPAWAAFLRT